MCQSQRPVHGAGAIAAHPSVDRLRRVTTAVLLAAVLVAACGQGAWGGPFADDFNRPDNTYLGQEWVEQAYDWSIVAGGTRSSVADVPALMTLCEFKYDDPLCGGHRSVHGRPGSHVCRAGPSV